MVLSTSSDTAEVHSSRIANLGWRRKKSKDGQAARSRAKADEEKLSDATAMMQARTTCAHAERAQQKADRG
jgi:hypothetical protein